MLTKAQRKRIQERFHIPVDSSCPSTYWIISIDGESQMPTVQELAQLRSYCGFIVRKIYREGWANKILEMPLPYCSGHNTTIFRKGNPLDPENTGWFYRKSTWSSGPFFVPCSTEKDYHTHTLVELLYRCENLLPERWTKWKLDHPKIFRV